MGRFRSNDLFTGIPPPGGETVRQALFCYQSVGPFAIVQGRFYAIGDREKELRLLIRPFGFVSGLTLGMAIAAPAIAHPHVFIDGGIDFIMSGQETLEALSVTWLYDEFETLYDLSSRGIEPLPDGSLSDADREAIRAAYNEWPDDFDGSAHLSIDGQMIEMDWPSDLAVDLVDGRLQLAFLRKLQDPT